jgi:4-carboxymuconolactone decarboxylase
MDSMTLAPPPVSRLPALPEPPEDPGVREIFATIAAQGRKVLNIHRVVSHAPRMIAAQVAYTTLLRQESSLPRPLQQLAILRTSQINGAAYELSVHPGVTLRLGVPAEKIDALASWQGSPLFDTKERAVLAFVEQAAGSGDVDDAVFDELARVLDAKEIVELAALVSWYVGNSRFAKSLKIKPERDETTA